MMLVPDRGPDPSFARLRQVPVQHLDREAVLPTFISWCELVKVYPFAWFRDVPGPIAEHPMPRLDELLPHHRAH